MMIIQPKERSFHCCSIQSSSRCSSNSNILHKKREWRGRNQLPVQVGEAEAQDKRRKGGSIGTYSSSYPSTTKNHRFDLLIPVSFFQKPGFLAVADSLHLASTTLDWIDPFLVAEVTCPLSLSISSKFGSPLLLLAAIWTLLQCCGSCSPSINACCKSRIIFLRIVFFMDRCFSMFSHSLT
jgi:hypothetical protein